MQKPTIIVVATYVSSCDHGMVHPWVADEGDDFHIWRVAVYVLNKHLW
jgi:hypothetical protein